MSNLTTINQLKEQFLVHDFIKKTVNQINKDLNGLVHNEIDVTNYETVTLEMLIEQLKLILIIMSTNSQLQQFVYAVDLPEKDWKYFTSFQNFEELATQVIVREAQKVYLRQMYSNL